MGKCFQSWTEENGNNSGRCCCNCKWQRSASGHPWNKNKFVQGSVSQKIGYVCLNPEFQHATFYENEHGMCEVHNWRE